jgi:hypothetical protein
MTATLNLGNVRIDGAVSKSRWRIRENGSQTLKARLSSLGR